MRSVRALRLIFEGMLPWARSQKATKMVVGGPTDYWNLLDNYLPPLENLYGQTHGRKYLDFCLGHCGETAFQPMHAQICLMRRDMCMKE